MSEISSLRNWFDSDYYHLLHDKDEPNLEYFYNNLVDKLKPANGSKLLEVGCGTGKYSKMLAEKGFDVTGIDFSFKEIHKAKELESDNLHFYQQDIRLPFWINYFDYAVNLQGIFGHYKTLREHDNAIRSISQSLQTNGLFVMEYVNVHYEEENIKTEEEMTLGGVEFVIENKDDEETFAKHIKVRREGKTVPVYTQLLQKFSIGDLTDMFAYQGMQIQEVYGDYDFSHYDIYKSPRLLLIARKMRRG